MIGSYGKYLSAGTPRQSEHRFHCYTSVTNFENPPRIACKYEGTIVDPLQNGPQIIVSSALAAMLGVSWQVVALTSGLFVIALYLHELWETGVTVWGDRSLVPNLGGAALVGAGQACLGWALGALATVLLL
jgi:hypothetical protein